VALDRHAPINAVLRLRVDVLELRVAVWMLGTFDGLVWRLQAVTVEGLAPSDSNHLD
jgi:hypothetical protein